MTLELCAYGMKMIDIAKTPEEALDRDWLCVWRNLVENYWDYTRRPDEENDPYYKKGLYYKPRYTFKSLRRDKHKSKEQIDEDVAELARNFWERNRSDLKEYFINCTCDNWPDKDKYELQRAIDGSEWLDCGVDPCYPDRKSTDNTYDASHLSDIGIFQELLEIAMRKARWDKLAFDVKDIAIKHKEHKDKLVEEKNRLRKEKIAKMKYIVSRFFNIFKF